MQPFDLELLTIPTFLIFLSVLICTLKTTNSIAISIVCSLMKSSFFLIYFGFYFDGTYTFSDDISYLEGGIKLLQRGINLTNLTEEWEYIQMIGRGKHVGYYLYNAFAISLFGDHYFSPIILNIILTALIARIGANLAQEELGLSKHRHKIFYIFILFHPNILAWSTLTNLKDIVVLFFHVILLSAGADFFRGKRIRALLKATPSFLVLYTIRFYVPLLIVSALGISVLISRKIKSRLALSVLGAITISLVIFGLGTGSIQSAFTALSQSKSNPIQGLIRATLTPIPFNSEPGYEFLNIPALFHWLMIPVAATGLRHLIKNRTPFINFLLIYLVLFLGLYGIYEELQGPRHRVQLDYALAILQFAGIFVLMNLRKKTISTYYHKN